MTVKFMSFSSGSCGNCAYLGIETEHPLPDGRTKWGVIIDAGVSLRKLKQALTTNGLEFNAVDAVLVTHEHGDHIRHLGSFCKRLGIPVYASSNLHEVLSRHPYTKDHIATCRRELVPDEWNRVAEAIEVRYFIVPHDAAETLGYTVNIAGRRFTLMTDLGHMTEEGLQYAKESDTVVIESDFDVDMLMSGSYTHELKMRIIQGYGHLSNDACADAIKRFYHKGLRNIFLCHISGNNNTPALAARSASEALQSLSASSEVSIRPLPRGICTPLLTL